MTALSQAKQQLLKAGFDFHADGGGGYEIYQAQIRIGRVYSDQELIGWQPPTVLAVDARSDKRIEYLMLDQIRTDGGTQARAGLDDATVAEYSETWQILSSRQNGLLEMPPIIVYYDGSAYWLADGFHRAAAYTQFLNGSSASASPRALRAEIRQGTRRDAVLFACGANAHHGLRRSNADKRRAIETLLRDDEWRAWSDSEIARRCQVDHKTVASARTDLYPGNSQDSRTVERNGATYQMTPAARSSAINTPDGSPAAPPARVPIPADLIGWHWMSGRLGTFQLTNGDYETRVYDHPDRAINGARLYLKSRQPDGAPTPGSWICERCGQPQTGMREPNPPVCTSCAMASLYHDAPARAAGLRTTHNYFHTDIDSALVSRLIAAGYIWEHAKQTPDGRWHHVISARNHALLRNDQVLLRRERLVAMLDLVVGQRADVHQPDPQQPPEPTTDDRRPNDRTAYEIREAADQVLLDDASAAITEGCYADARALLDRVQVRTFARDALAAKLPAAPPDPRAQAATLLRQLAALMQQITTDDQEGLSMAIANLNECPEGSEAAHWIAVGWALLDLEAEA